MSSTAKDKTVEINVRTGSGKWEDNYKLSTFYIHKDILEVLNEECKKAGKGAKTKIVNEALKDYLGIS